VTTLLKSLNDHRVGIAENLRPSRKPAFGKKREVKGKARAKREAGKVGAPIGKKSSKENVLTKTS